jgi:hypothetical protein
MHEPERLSWYRMESNGKFKDSPRRYINFSHGVCLCSATSRVILQN